MREWLGAMTTGGIVEVDPDTNRFSLPAERAAHLTRAAVADNMACFAQYIGLLGGVEDEIVECFKRGGVPYAIDFLNPAPDFERDRITDFYFTHVLEKMSDLVIDRALNPDPTRSWPRWEEMLGIGAPTGFSGAPRASVATT